MWKTAAREGGSLRGAVRARGRAGRRSGGGNKEVKETQAEEEV